jgi:hypothetical protein
VSDETPPRERSASDRRYAEPRYARPWTEHELGRALALHQAGLSASEIGTRLERPKDGVLKQIKLARDRQIPTVRTCERCGRTLSRYNPNLRCYPCLAGIAA